SVPILPLVRGRAAEGGRGSISRTCEATPQLVEPKVHIIETFHGWHSRASWRPPRFMRINKRRECELLYFRDWRCYAKRDIESRGTRGGAAPGGSSATSGKRVLSNG